MHSNVIFFMLVNMPLTYDYAFLMFDSSHSRQWDLKLHTFSETPRYQIVYFFRFLRQIYVIWSIFTWFLGYETLNNIWLYFFGLTYVYKHTWNFTDVCITFFKGTSLRSTTFSWRKKTPCFLFLSGNAVMSNPELLRDMVRFFFKLPCDNVSDNK